MPKMDRYFFVWLLLVSFMNIITVFGCPERCQCISGTVRCMFLNLDRIPEIPKDTVVLDLRFNNIKEIPHGKFVGLSHLNTLLLNNNRIRKLHDGAFEGLTDLRYLYLYRNEINHISKDAFLGLNRLEQLYLHYNNLNSLEPGLFNNLPGLERLFLHNNDIQKLPRGVFSGMPLLQRLRLDSNSLVCDCELLWLNKLLRGTGDDAGSSVICDGPDNMKGKKLMDMSEDDFHCKKPEIVVTPSDIEVTFGSTAAFTCRASGDPKPEIIWMRDNKLFSEELATNSIDETRYSVLEDGTLMIKDAQPADSGVYECVARNAMGETKTDAVQLTYQGDEPADPDYLSEDNSFGSRPRITRPPQNHAVVQGETIALECRAVGNPTPSITWTRNDLPIPQDPRYRYPDASTLIVDGVGVVDRGLFRCTASNQAGSTSANARVEILVPPSIMERPSDQTITDGQPAWFICRVTGQPHPDIQWYKDGREVGVYGSRYTVSDGGTTLWINHVALDDTGTFECRAENSAGRTDAGAQLSVTARVAPTLLRPPSDARIAEGASAEFVCLINADPPASIRWLKNGRGLFTSSKYEITQNEESLIVRGANRGDEGIYECIAENTAGSVRAFARLTILGNDAGVADSHSHAGREITDNSISQIDDSFVRSTVRESLFEVDRAYNNTLRDLYDTSRPKTPGELLALMRLPSTQLALQISRSAEVFERTLEILHNQIHAGATYNITHGDQSYQEILTPLQLDIVSDLSGCASHRRVIDCEDMCYHHKYRTFDGTCNNLKHPMWGASLTPMSRLLPPRYENGFNTPPGWNPGQLYHGFELPSARHVSLEIASSHHTTDDDEFSHMLMQWGQFHDHDITFVPQAVSNARFSDGRYCNETCDNQSPCFPIPISQSDPRIHRRRCMGVTRSSAMCGSGMTSLFFGNVFQREQLNQITAYIDASSVYGSSEEEARNLRDFSNNNGLLRTGHILPSGKTLLPPNVGEPVDCQMDPNKAHVPCFQAGDHRSNEQLGLLSMHTLWMREHNRIARELKRYNQHWDGDTIYHETRKIIGAMFQHITYEHWLPKILGTDGMEKLGEYKGYDPHEDSTIINSFATAAFRFGHSLINPVISRLNESMQPTEFGNLPLHKAFFAPFRLLEEGGIDPILRGLYGTSAKKLRPSEFLNTELTEKLFKLAHEVALDLAALNIQRGRDHGLPSYNQMRERCGLRPARLFEDLRREITDRQLLGKLREVYGHPDNIDLWIGGLSEELIPGAKVGPTFHCILVDQFKRLRDGDRFWYENPGVFTPNQLLEIKAANLARVICDSSDGIRQVPKDVFLKSDYPHDYLSCEDEEEIPRIDIKVWAGCCYDCSRSGSFQSITGHVRNRRSTDYSYPEDRPQSDQPVHQEVGDKHEETHHLKTKTSAHSMMDVVDTRIEGMEEMMEHVMHSMDKLNKKIRRMHRQMKSGSGRKLHHRECKDHRGAIRKNNERWREHDCRVCECKNGTLECITETCQIPKCDSPRKIAGQCCPVCDK